MTKDNSRLEMIETNKDQEDFYDRKTRKGIITSIWDGIRNKTLNGLRTSINAKGDIYSLHKIWAGNLMNKRVLDLGCYSGNELSIHFAQHAEEYVGIDLSQRGIEMLNDKLNKIGNPKAKAIRMDFLSNELEDYGKFDVIYIYSAMHHFRYFDVFLNRLNKFLKPGGIIISYDPLQTYWIMRFLRFIYRPFQSDADWEFPFRKSTFQKIQNIFKIEKVQGVLNKAKWGFLLNFLPLNNEKRLKIIRSWHKNDIEHANKIDSYLFGCLHVSLLLRKKT